MGFGVTWPLDGLAPSTSPDVQTPETVCLQGGQGNVRTPKFSRAD